MVDDVEGAADYYPFIIGKQQCGRPDHCLGASVASKQHNQRYGNDMIYGLAMKNGYVGS